MKELWVYIFAICTLIFLSGCKFNVTADLYIADIREVVLKENSNLTTSATLEVEVPSQEKCNESSDELIRLMEGLVLNLSPRGCVDIGFSTYLLLDTDIPIVNGMIAWEQADTLLGVMTLISDNVVQVYMMNNLEKFEILSKRVRDEHFQSLDISKSIIKVILNNDAQTETITARGVFLNGDPVDNFEEYELKRRKELEIKLSNVAAANLGTDGNAFAFLLQN